MEKVSAFSFSKSAKIKSLSAMKIVPLINSSTKKPSLTSRKETHLPAINFKKQLERKIQKEIDVNEKRFDYMPKIKASRQKINFEKVCGRPELFKMPEFLHEYYINMQKKEVAKEKPKPKKKEIDFALFDIK